MRVRKSFGLKKQESDSSRTETEIQVSSMPLLTIGEGKIRLISYKERMELGVLIHRIFDWKLNISISNSSPHLILMILKKS